MIKTFLERLMSFTDSYSDENDSVDTISLTWKGTSKKKASQEHSYYRFKAGSRRSMTFLERFRSVTDFTLTIRSLPLYAILCGARHVSPWKVRLESPGRPGNGGIDALKFSS
jgi:hypothetical protein